MAHVTMKEAKPKKGGKPKHAIGVHIRKAKGGFISQYEHEPDADDVGRYTPPQPVVHANLKKAYKHAEEAFGPPDAGEPAGGDPGSAAKMASASADTGNAGGEE